MNIRTYQDTLGDWHAVIDDADDNTLAIVPKENAYGTETEEQAVKMAQRIIARYERSFVPNM